MFQMCLVSEKKNWLAIVEVVEIESVVISMDPTKRHITFDEEFNNYYPLIVKKIMFMVGNREIAEDIAQETFIKFFNTNKKEIANVKAWLLRVAINLTYNYIRSEKNRKDREEKIVSEKVIDISEEVIKKEEGKIIRKALSKLSERDNQLIVFKYAGYSYREIAEILDIEETSVGTFLARAKKRFKEILTDLKGSEPNAY